MKSYFLKAWLWIKGIVLAALVLYLIVFIAKNNVERVPVWLWVNYAPTVSLLGLIFTVLAMGVLVTLLLRTILSTLRQISEARERSRTSKLEKEMAEMRAKAQMLQQRESASAAPPPAHQVDDASDAV